MVPSPEPHLLPVARVAAMAGYGPIRVFSQLNAPAQFVRDAAKLSPTLAAIALEADEQPKPARFRLMFQPVLKMEHASGLPVKAKPGCAAAQPAIFISFLSVKPHEFFQRDGADIFCRVPISMTTAALGGQFEVGTVDGSKTRVKVPEGTQAGKQFRLRSKGMPVLRSNQLGDMYIQVSIETPQNLTTRQREIFKEFERVSSEENSPESSSFFTRMKGFFENLAD